MLSTKQVKQSKLLQKTLSKATCFEDLIPFLKVIEFGIVRTFVQQQLCNTSDNISHCLPITDLLHENVIQHILLFTNTISALRVCKAFLNSCHKNAMQKKKQFLIENKYASNNVDQAYQLTIKHLYIQDQELKLQQSIKQYKKGLNTIKTLQKTLDKKKWALFQELHDIHKPYLSSVCNYNTKEIKLPPFAKKFSTTFNNEYTVYPNRKAYTRARQTVIHNFQGKRLSKSTRRQRIKEYKQMSAVGFADFFSDRSEAKIKQGDIITLTAGNYTCSSRDDMDGCSGQCRITSKTVYLNGQTTLKNYDKDNQVSPGAACIKISGEPITDETQMIKVRYRSMFVINLFSNVYFRNISIDGSKHEMKYYRTITVGTNCGLWIENCIINTSGIGITICENARCFVKNCTFIGGSIGVQINTMAKEVLITDCTFINCGCETVYDHQGQNGAIVIGSGQERYGSTKRDDGDPWNPSQSSLEASQLTEAANNNDGIIVIHRDEFSARLFRCMNLWTKFRCDSISKINKKLDIGIINNKFENNFNVPIMLKVYSLRSCLYTKEGHMAQVEVKCHIKNNKLQGFNPRFKVDNHQNKQGEHSCNPNAIYLYDLE